MSVIKSPGALILPFYILGTAFAIGTYQLLPMNIGYTVSAVLVLILLTFTSWLHSKIEGSEPVIHIILWGICGGIAVAFAANGLVDIPGAAVIGTKENWWQFAFVAVQQACYFGLHAFRH